MSLDPSTTPSVRTNEEAQSKIWNGFCQEVGLIDFLCVFVSLAHLSAMWRKERRTQEGKGRERRRKEKERKKAVRGHPLGLQPKRGEYVQTLGVPSQSISTEWDSSGRTPALLCTALHCVAFCLHARLPVSLTAATSGRGASGFKKNICRAASSQASKQS